MRNEDYTTVGWTSPAVKPDGWVAWPADDDDDNDSTSSSSGKFGGSSGLRQVRKAPSHEDEEGVLRCHLYQSQAIQGTCATGIMDILSFLF